MNYLADNFYSSPDFARMTMTRKHLKETLLDTTGEILSCGRLRTIKSKHLGAGVYEVSLEAPQ